jgi:hypothetical protein
MPITKFSLPWLSYAGADADLYKSDLRNFEGRNYKVRFTDAILDTVTQSGLPALLEETHGSMGNVLEQINRDAIQATLVKVSTYREKAAKYLRLPV